MYIRGIYALFRSGSSFGCCVLKRYMYCNQRLLRKDLMYCAGCHLSVVNINLIVMSSFCVPGIYIHLEKDSYRRGRDFSAHSM